ncbi:hypothetical protein K2Y11_19170 [bacterium]|nr:hypothetical protein [bacterium]
MPNVLEMLKNRGNGPGRGASTAPTSYRVKCLCGETVEGYRQNEYQTLTCPSCQGTIFVLGDSPLLSPDPPQPPPVNRSDLKAVHSFVRRRSLRGRLRLARAGVARFRKGTAARVKRLFAIRNLVIVAVLLIVSFTAYRQLKIRSEQLTRAEVDRLSHAGMIALEAGEIPDAEEKLSQAVAWMNHTKQPEQDWEAIRHVAAETNAACRMLQQPLDMALTFVAGDMSGRQSQIAGKGLLLDVVVTSTDDGGWSCDLVTFVNNEVVPIRFPRESLYRESSFSAPTRVLLFARLSSLQKTDREWSLSFEPKSVVLITQASLLAYLGVADKESQDLVKQQVKVLDPLERE